MTDIKLGSKVEDIVTGFTGIVVSKVEYLTGCTQYGIVPQNCKDGTLPSAEYLDWQRLKVLAGPIDYSSSSTGGPQRDQPRR